MRISNRKAKTFAILSAAATLAVAAQSSHAQVWANPGGGVWSNAANWVGGAPVSANTTQVTFNVSGAQTYTSTVDGPNPFILNTLTVNHTGTGVLTLNGNALSFQGASAGATIAGAGTGGVAISNFLGGGSAVPAGFTAGPTFTKNSAGTLSLSGGGLMFRMALNNGTTTYTAGTTDLTSSQSVGTGVGASVPHSFSVGAVDGQTARFVQTGGTINILNGYVGDSASAVGIATFTGASTVLNSLTLNAGTGAPDPTSGTGGRFGVDLGTGTINVEAGATINCRLLEVGRNTNATGAININGGTINANQVAIQRVGAGSFAVNVSNNGRLNCDLSVNPATGSFAVAGSFIAPSGNASGSSLNVTTGGQVRNTGNLTVAGGQDATLTADASDFRINLSGANSRMDVVRQVLNVGGTPTNFGGQIVAGQGNPTGAAAGIATINVSSGATMTGFTMFTAIAPADRATYTINGGTLSVPEINVLGGGGGAGTRGGITTVNVTGGGNYTAGDFTVAQNGAAAGGAQTTLNVSGAGSTIRGLNDAGALSDGDVAAGFQINATGTVALSAGAVATIDGTTFLGLQAGGKGIVTVDGAGSAYNGAGALITGGNVNDTIGDPLDGGAGTFSVTNGGAASFSGVANGSRNNSTGFINVSGTNSVMTVNDAAGTAAFNMGVSDTAVATLNVSNGGRVNVNGGTSQFLVGSGGNAALTINNGTVTVGGNMFMGTGTTSITSGLVDAGTLAVGNQLQVGGSGATTGSPTQLTIVNGGRASSGGLAFVFGTSTINIGAGTVPARLTTGLTGVDGRINYNSGTFNTAGTLAVGGTVALSDAARNAAGTPSNKKVLEAGTLTMTASGVIDLNDNDAIFKNNTYGQISTFIKNARNNGAWNQPGITSTAAKNASPQNKTLGTVRGDEWTAANGAALFNGRTVSATDVLVKYTYYGDATFDGRITFDDYAKIDSGFNAARTGWFNGDFNYDGTINFDDYGLIDQAFLTQGSTVLGRPGPMAGPAGDREIIGVSVGGMVAATDGNSDVFTRYADALGTPVAGGNNGALRSVPEPGTITVIGAGMLGMLARRRRAR